MFDDAPVCPYTGLRSFTEEESIYFKGRDEHIEQATKMLEENKFLMLTGASGDGKSSLVYAGIIPNARSGFLKATNVKWAIADFRPERDPFDNLCESIADTIGISSTSTVKSELSHGFSALADLYKSSNLYADQYSNEWLDSDEEQRKKLLRESGNLLILVDQFEEFFTNPENYNRGTTSNDANLVLNLLLETARIALEDNLPIYIVFTMRSDYIGQCAAFRGLPEYIGFSQFFVPRLNRQQLQEVIEEPAELSGNRISRRLTERIIHDIEDGVDQLPILQHTLNQIWKAATEGTEELDLIHYAMVGGMPESELQPNDKERFNKWFNNLPRVIQDCYHKPSLQNVLDTHANKIYASAAFQYKKRTGSVISDDDAHAIIRTTFSCLTKIDESRAVRNRMTLTEITEILNKPHLNPSIISHVIAIFREAGNTFIKPFTQEEEEITHVLAPETVLDITHESLIRNWSMLKDWANEEFESFMILKDFKQQVDRWLEYKKSYGFLLPIGPLTYFENWFKETNPNPYWVNRYNELVTDTEKNIDESIDIVNNSKEFLKRSNRKHAITRVVMQFGPKKIAAVFAVVILILSSSFIFYDQYSKKNSFVLSKAIEEGEELLGSNLTDYKTRSEYIINRERLEKGAGLRVLSMVDNPRIQFELAVATSQTVGVYNYKSLENEFTADIFKKSAEIAIRNYQLVQKLELNKIKYMATLLELIDIIDLNNHFADRDDYAELSNSLSKILGSIVLNESRRPSPDVNIKELNESLEVAINHHAFTEEELAEMILLLSPFEEQQQVSLITSHYTRDKSILTGTTQNKLTYNGLYQILGELYSAVGNWESVIRSVDTLLLYQPRYEDYATDAYSMGGVMASYGRWEDLEMFYKALSSRFSIEPYIAFRRTAERMGYSSQPIPFRFFHVQFSRNSWDNPILDMIADSTRENFYDYYLKSIIGADIGTDEKQFAMALYYKQKGIFYAKIQEDRNQSVREEVVDELFSKSISHYRNVGNRYLAEPVSTFFRLPETIPRSHIYLYPDYRQITHHFEHRSRYSRYYSGTFLEFLIRKGHFESFYTDPKNVELIVKWINEYKNGYWDHLSFMYFSNEMKMETLESLHELLTNHSERDQLNTNLLKFILANNFFKVGETEKAVDMARSIDPVGIQGILQEEFGFNIGKTFDLIKNVYSDLIIIGEVEIASGIMESFINDANKVRMYDFASIMSYRINLSTKGSVYLDSASLLMESMRSLTGGFFGGIISSHSYAQFLSDNIDNKREALRNSNELNSFLRIDRSYRLIAGALALNGHYHEAVSFTSNASPEERLIFINQLLYSQENLEMTGWEFYDRVWNFRYLFNGFAFGS